LRPHVRCGRHLWASAGEVMARAVTYSIVDCPDGQFAVVAVSASSAVYRRGGLLTLREVEICLETLRLLTEACGAALVHRDVERSLPQ
jgi:hypothetical protein